MKSKIFRLLMLCLLALTTLTVNHAASATTTGMATLDDRADVVIMADPDGKPGTAVLPPASFLASRATTDVNTIDQTAVPGIYVSEWIGSWDTEAQTAFQYAIDIWNYYLDTNGAPIAIEATWQNLGPGILGGASANLSLAPDGNVYATANWNAQNSADMSQNEAEIFTTFNSAFSNWYFGVDGNTPFNQYDFASVVLHEIGHGLGFFGSMTSENSVGYWGYRSTSGNIYPSIYDRFTETGGGLPLLNITNGSTTLHEALVSDSLYFNGTHANTANGGQRVKLYAPSLWSQGSSYSHVDEIFNPTPNALMTYSLAPGEVVHNPGPIALGMLRDTKLTIETYPVLSDLPKTILALADSENNNLLDLAYYYSDADTSDDNLNVAVSSSDPRAGVEFDGTYIDVRPESEFTGTTTVTVTVTDTAGLEATGSFDVKVVASLTYTYLPTILR